MKSRTIFWILGGLAAIWVLIKVAQISDTAKRLENRVKKRETFFGDFFKPITGGAKIAARKVNSLFSSAGEFFLGGTGGTGSGAN